MTRESFVETLVDAARQSAAEAPGDRAATARRIHDSLSRRHRVRRKRLQIVAAIMATLFGSTAFAWFAGWRPPWSPASTAPAVSEPPPRVQRVRAAAAPRPPVTSPEPAQPEAIAAVEPPATAPAAPAVTAPAAPTVTAPAAPAVTAPAVTAPAPAAPAIIATTAPAASAVTAPAGPVVTTPTAPAAPAASAVAATAAPAAANPPPRAVASSPPRAEAPRTGGTPRVTAAPGRLPLRTTPPDERPRVDNAPPAAPTAPTAPLPPTPSEELALYRRAHDAHFRGTDLPATLAAWDAYLARYPDGQLAPEARYDRALILIKLERWADAAAALRPFASAPAGSYRQAEATRLLEAIRRR